jgi:hypothetical protein
MFVFEHLQFGPYVVYGDDEERGYSNFSTGPNASGFSWKAPRVELSAAYPEREVNWQLPPPAGSLSINLRDAMTGAVIPELQLTITEADPQRTFLGKYQSATIRTMLIPSDRDVLLHVSADGYGEWRESVGIGKPIHLAPGERMQLEVRLEPSN